LTRAPTPRADPAYQDDLDLVAKFKVVHAARCRGRVAEAVHEAEALNARAR
jgi:hypothetical protein